MTKRISANPQQDVEFKYLEAQVHARLNGRVRKFRIRLDENGSLILEGSATTYYAKQMAQHAVLELADRPIAANDIVVR